MRIGDSEGTCPSTLSSCAELPCRDTQANAVERSFPHFTFALLLFTMNAAVLSWIAFSDASCAYTMCPDS